MITKHLTKFELLLCKKKFYLEFVSKIYIRIDIIYNM